MKDSTRNGIEYKEYYFTNIILYSSLFSFFPVIRCANLKKREIDSLVLSSSACMKMKAIYHILSLSKESQLLNQAWPVRSSVLSLNIGSLFRVLQLIVGVKISISADHVAIHWDSEC